MEEAQLSIHRFDNGDLGLVVSGPGWEERMQVPGLAEEGLVYSVRDFVGETQVKCLHIYGVNFCANTLRRLFGEFPHLEHVDMISVNCADEDLGVLMPNVLRGKPLGSFGMFRCNPVRAGLRDLLQLAESAPGMHGVSVVDIGRAWEREETLFAARLVETHRSVTFRFGVDVCAPMKAAINRAAERARLPTYDITRPNELVRGRNCVLALLTGREDAPVSRFLRRDGDHAIALRVLAMLGGNVGFDATTVEQAYDACVLGGVV